MSAMMTGGGGAGAGAMPQAVGAGFGNVAPAVAEPLGQMAAVGGGSPIATGASLSAPQLAPMSSIPTGPTPNLAQFTSNPGGQLPSAAGPAKPPSSLWGQLAEDVGSMGYDDYSKLLEGAFQGGGGGGGEAGPQFPQMNQANPLAAVGQPGSAYFHSLYQSGGGGGGSGLF
jgi:hypothetical protein